PHSTLFPYTTLFRSIRREGVRAAPGASTQAHHHPARQHCQTYAGALRPKQAGGVQRPCLSLPSGLRDLPEAGQALRRLVSARDGGVPAARGAYAFDPARREMRAGAASAARRQSYSARPVIAPSSIAYSGFSRASSSANEASPPDALTGMRVARASSAVAGRFKPFRTPSRSISV